MRTDPLVPSGIGSGLEVLHPHLALDWFVQGNHGVCGLDVGDLLDGVQKDLHKVVIIQAVELCKYSKAAGDEMTLYNLRNFLKI